MLVGYAMNAAPSTMQNPYSGAIVDGAPYELDGECVWGRGACEQKGSLAAMMAAMRFVGANKVELLADLYFVVSTVGETGRSTGHVLDHATVKQIGDHRRPPEINWATRTGRRARDRAWEVRTAAGHGRDHADGAMRVLEK
jgi:hypothetical protein